MNIIDALMGTSHNEKSVKIKGSVVLMKKNVLDFNDFQASFLDRVHEFLGKGVSFQLVSAEHGDPGQLLCYSMFPSFFISKFQEEKRERESKSNWNSYSFSGNFLVMWLALIKGERDFGRGHWFSY